MVKNKRPIGRRPQKPYVSKCEVLTAYRALAYVKSVSVCVRASTQRFFFFPVLPEFSGGGSTIFHPGGAAAPAYIDPRPQSPLLGFPITLSRHKKKSQRLSLKRERYKHPPRSIKERKNNYFFYFGNDFPINLNCCSVFAVQN